MSEQTQDVLNEARAATSEFYDRLITVSTGSIAAVGAFGGLTKTVA